MKLLWKKGLLTSETRRYDIFCSISWLIFRINFFWFQNSDHPIFFLWFSNYYQIDCKYKTSQIFKIITEEFSLRTKSNTKRFFSKFTCFLCQDFYLLRPSKNLKFKCLWILVYSLFFLQRTTGVLNHVLGSNKAMIHTVIKEQIDKRLIEILQVTFLIYI